MTKKIKTTLTITAALLCITMIGGISLLAADNASKQDQLATQRSLLVEQGKQIQQLTENNPRTLEGCLDRAALDYSNEIKTKGTLSANGDQPSYNMSMEDWKQVDDRLQRARSDCHTLYGT